MFFTIYLYYQGQSYRINFLLLKYYNPYELAILNLKISLRNINNKVYRLVGINTLSISNLY